METADRQNIDMRGSIAVYHDSYIRTAWLYVPAMVEPVVLQKICIAAIHVELSTDCRKLAKQYHRHTYLDPPLWRVEGGSGYETRHMIA